MSIASEVGLTASRELRKNLRSAKGLAMGALFLLGGAGGSMAYLQLSRYALSQGASNLPDEALKQIKLELLKKAYPEATASYLVDCPTVLLFLFKGTLLAIPLLTLLAGFDIVAGEVQHRTLRFFVGRATRPSVVAGKALGLWAMVAAMVLLLHMVVWGIALVQGDGTAGQIASWGLRWWLLSVACAGCYAGLTTLVSAVFRTPVVALFAGVAVLAAMGILSVVFSLSGAEQLEYALPGKYDGLLVSHDPLRVLGGVGALLGWMALTTGAAAELVRRRDA